MWTRTLVCSVLMGAAMAAMSKDVPLQPKPEKYSHLEGCYIKELDRVLPFNSAAPSKSHCIEYRCRQEFVVYTLCKVPFEEESSCTTLEWKVVEDKHKPFPDCCPRVVCSDDHPDVHTNDTALA